jgi:uncharacterized membrane protein
MEDEGLVSSSRIQALNKMGKSLSRNALLGLQLYVLLIIGISLRRGLRQL